MADGFNDNDDLKAWISSVERRLGRLDSMLSDVERRLGRLEGKMNVTLLILGSILGGLFAIFAAIFTRL